MQFYFTFIDYYDFVYDMTIQIVEFLYVCLPTKMDEKKFRQFLFSFNLPLLFQFFGAL